MTPDPAGPPSFEWLRPPAGPRTVLLLGAFDPPTNAHLALVQGASRVLSRAGALCLTTVLLGRKRADELLDLPTRLEVLDLLAAERGLGLAVANRGTYLEVAEAAGGDVWFVVGSDKLPQISDPSFYPDGLRGVQRTFAELTFCVVERGVGIDRKDVVVLDADSVFDDPRTAALSASEVRRRLSEGISVEDAVPALVAGRLEGYTQDPSRHR